MDGNDDEVEHEPTDHGGQETVAFIHLENAIDGGC